MFTENVEGQPDAVPNTLFDTYYESNLRFPQSHLALVTFTANSLMSLANIEWDRFARAKLTKQQLTKLSTAMTNVHRKQGIPLVASNRIAEGERPVPDGKIHTLWESVKADVVDLAYRYALFSEGNVDEASKLSAPRITTAKLEKVKKFFGNPTNQDATANFKRIIQSATNAMQQSEPVTTSIKKYKTELGFIPQERKNQLLLVIAQEIRKSVEQDCGDSSIAFFDIMTKCYNS